MPRRKGLLACWAGCRHLTPHVPPYRAPQEEEEGAAGGSYSDGEDRASFAGAAAQPPRLDICYADEASKLLAELAASHEAVGQLLEETELAPARRASCAIM